MYATIHVTEAVNDHEIQTEKPEIQVGTFPLLFRVMNVVNTLYLGHGDFFCEEV